MAAENAPTKTTARNTLRSSFIAPSFVLLIVKHVAGR